MMPFDSGVISYKKRGNVLNFNAGSRTLPKKDEIMYFTQTWSTFPGMPRKEILFGLILLLAGPDRQR
jgi:hypothetical protein